MRSGEADDATERRIAILDAQKPVTLTAIIPCRPEAVAEVEAALVAVGRYVKANEPGTLDYRVIRADGDAPVYITHERFRDREAMRIHNDGAGSKGFFAATDGLLGDVALLTGDELLATA